MKSACLLFALSLAGCAPHLEGAYVDATGDAAFKLANGKYVQPPGNRAASRPLPYKVDGAVIIVGTGRDQSTYAILPGGALQLNRNGQVFTIAAR